MLNLISGHIKVSGSTFSKSPIHCYFLLEFFFFLVMDIPVIPMDLLGDEVFTMRKLKLPQNFSGSVYCYFSSRFYTCSNVLNVVA